MLRSCRGFQFLGPGPYLLLVGACRAVMGHFPAIRIALGVVFLCLCFPAPGAPAGPSNCSLGATFTVWIPGVVTSALVIWDVFSRPWWSPDPRRSFLECLFSARSCYFSIGSLAGGGQLTLPPFLPKILACSRIFRIGDVCTGPCILLLACFFFSGVLLL